MTNAWQALFEYFQKEKKKQLTFWDHLSPHTVANASILNTFTNSWSYVKTYAPEKEETWEKWC